MPRKRTNLPENYNAPLPSQLRRLMSSSGHTQADLANHLGITRQSVSAYMDGSANPTPSAIVSIANFLGVSTDYLLGVSSYEKAETALLTVEDIGLSERAATILQSENNQIDRSKLIVLNYLIENPSFWEKISSYFAFSTYDIARKKPFSRLTIDKRNMDARLSFADIIENLQKYKSDFFDSIKADNYAIEQMVLSLIGNHIDHSTAEQWCQLLYDARGISNKDEQLSVMAKFLRFYGYSDYTHRLGCDLEHFIISDEEKEG